MQLRNRIPTFDYEVVRGDTLRMLLQYAPGGTLFDWGTDDRIEIAVRLPDDTEIAVPVERIEMVPFGTVSGADGPNVISAFIPAETDRLPIDTPCAYQVRLVQSTDDVLTILAGMITVRFSAVEG